MSKTLEGMARAACDADGCDGDYDKNPPEIREALAVDMKRALLWLADNVSDEMVLASIMLPNDPMAEQLKAAFKNSRHADTIERTRASIARALRAAAEGSDPTPPEVK